MLNAEINFKLSPIGYCLYHHKFFLVFQMRLAAVCRLFSCLVVNSIFEKREKVLLTGLCLLLGGGVATFSYADKTEQLIALKCGILLDVEQKDVFKNVTVLVKDELITAVEQNFSIPKSVQVVDLSDQTCLPGLMDMHVHPMISDGKKLHMVGPVSTGVAEIKSSAQLTINAVRNVGKLLDNGFTTLRIVGGADRELGLIDLRNAINQGVLIGPRLFVAPHRLFPTTGITRFPQNVSAGADAAREAVRNQVKYGADLIKVAGDIGGVWKDEISRWFTDDEMQAFADEAHGLNKRITTHAHGAELARVAVFAGFDSIDHGFFISKATAQEMKKRGTWLVPTVGVFDYHLDKGGIFSKGPTGGLPPEKKRQYLAWKKRYEKRNESFQYAYKTGVKMAFGTDNALVVNNSREFSYLSRLGVSNWDGIAMATINGAELLGQRDTLGSIKVGKFADIIAVPGNPLDDIEILEDVSFVMKGGQIIRRN